MKYFIDLEASQYNEKIISIGCVDEFGRTFYSLVRPTSKKVITEFITNLTGLTYDVLSEAPTAEKVFSDFAKWLGDSAFNEQSNFYVYGNADKTYLSKTLKILESFSSKKTCVYIIDNLVDYCESKIKNKFKSELALVTLLSFYRKDYISSQQHNALEDACWLREVYNYVENDANEYSESFTNNIREKYPKIKVEYPKKDTKNAEQHKKIPMKTNEKDTISGTLIGQRVSNQGNFNGKPKKFYKWSTAVFYIMKLRAKKNKNEIPYEEILINIKRTSANGGIYNRYKWTLE